MSYCVESSDFFRMSVPVFTRFLFLAGCWNQYPACAFRSLGRVRLFCVLDKLMIQLQWYHHSGSSKLYAFLPFGSTSWITLIDQTKDRENEILHRKIKPYKKFTIFLLTKSRLHSYSLFLVTKETYPGVMYGNPAGITDFELTSRYRTHVPRVGEPTKLDVTQGTDWGVGLGEALLPFVVQVFVLLSEIGML